MPAFEAHHQKNGVYMTELLKHIQKDQRIENILMNVNQAVHTNPFVVQRPVFETDTIDDCRLTCQIDDAANYAHWSARFNTWFEVSSKEFCSSLKVCFNDGILWCKVFYSFKRKLNPRI